MHEKLSSVPPTTTPKESMYLVAATARQQKVESNFNSRNYCGINTATIFTYKKENLHGVLHQAWSAALNLLEFVWQVAGQERFVKQGLRCG